MSKLKKGKNWWFNIEFPPFPPLLIRLPSKCELILGTRTMFTKRLQKIIVSSSVSSQVVTLIRHCWVFVGFSRELCSSLQSLTRKSTRTEHFLFILYTRYWIDLMNVPLDFDQLTISAWKSGLSFILVNPTFWFSTLNKTNLVLVSF